METLVYSEESKSLSAYLQLTAITSDASFHAARLQLKSASAVSNPLTAALIARDGDPFDPATEATSLRETCADIDTLIDFLQVVRLQVGAHAARRSQESNAEKIANRKTSACRKTGGCETSLRESRQVFRYGSAPERCAFCEGLIRSDVTTSTSVA